uniref:uncharacterized protein LOC122588297 n=1 Tax=Erigeron canadensis TaxID=72917 RepID=UPI001CB92E51|nr:uncharacterized protein LOC122588297 [Erigeron canadensis]
MQSSTVSSAISPASFTTNNSSNNLADVAARVVEEFRHNNDDYDDIFNDHDHHSSEFSAPNNDCNPEHDHDDNENENDDEFEFAVVRTDVNNLRIIPQYPLFDRNLLLDVDPNLIHFVNDTTEIVRLPLHKLFNEEREFTSSESTSSESDDLDGVNPNTYCVWKPPEKSTSSRRWKIRDILFRSNSDSKTTSFGKKNDENSDGAVKSESRGSRRRLYLPFRQALVDSFSNVSQSNRNLRPF